MLTETEILAQADIFILSMNLDDTHRMAYTFGARWANNQNAAEIEKLKRTEDTVARLKAENEELLCALQLLYDEQNDAPLEHHRERWQLAMDTAQIALEKYDRTT